jgi:hypothetical protein
MSAKIAGIISLAALLIAIIVVSTFTSEAARLEWYDRNPTYQHCWYDAIIAPAVLTARCSRTSPSSTSGRSWALTSMTLFLMRQSSPIVSGEAQVKIMHGSDGDVILACAINSTVVETECVTSWGGWMKLDASWTFGIYTADVSTGGGTVHFMASFNLVEFDT